MSFYPFGKIVSFESTDRDTNISGFLQLYVEITLHSRMEQQMYTILFYKSQC